MRVINLRHATHDGCQRAGADIQLFKSPQKRDPVTFINDDMRKSMANRNIVNLAI